MGRRKQPVALVVANGKKHLTKAEKERRRAEEVNIPPTLQYCPAPDYLFEWPRLVERFNAIAVMLHELMPQNFGEPDAEVLARYVVAEASFELYTSKLMSALMADDLEAHKALHMEQNRAFTQAQAAASVLGLTVTSRCKLVVPGGGDGDDEDELI